MRAFPRASFIAFVDHPAHYINYKARWNVNEKKRFVLSAGMGWRSFLTNVAYNRHSYLEPERSNVYDSILPLASVGGRGRVSLVAPYSCVRCLRAK